MEQGLDDGAAARRRRDLHCPPQRAIRRRDRRIHREVFKKIKLPSLGKVIGDAFDRGQTKAKPLIDAILGLRGISSAIQTYTAVMRSFGRVFSVIGGYINSLKARLGIDPDSGLTIGALRALAVASAGYAAYMERDWMKIRLAMTQSAGAFDSVKKASTIAAVSYGLSTDSMIALTSKLTDEQKLSGKTFSDTMEIVAKFSIGNEELAAQVSDMTQDFREFGLTIDKQKKVLSAYIVIGQETRATLEDLTAGTRQAHGAFTQLALKGGDVDAAMVNVAATAGVMKNNYMDVSKAYEIFDGMMDPMKIGDMAGMLNLMAQSTGMTTGQLYAMAQSDFGSFMGLLAQTIGGFDTTKLGVLDALLAQMGGAGVSKEFIASIKMMQARGGMGAFVSDLGSTTSMAMDAMKAGKALQDRWNSYTSVMTEAWNKVKNAFMAILMLIGEPILATIKPFVMGSRGSSRTRLRDAGDR